jgi:tRNA modification GTPase
LPNDVEKVFYVANKADKLSEEQKERIKQSNHILISAKYQNGINILVDELVSFIKEKFTPSSGNLITRQRYREALKDCLDNLNRFSLNKEIELSAEDIRLACRSLGSITGLVKVDEILDNIFSSFCIGK